MSGTRRPEPALDVLDGLRHPVPTADGTAAPHRRLETIDAIARAIRTPPTDRRRMRALAWCAAAAMLLAVGGGAWMVEGRMNAPSRSAAVTPGTAAIELRVTAGVVVTTRRGLPQALSAGSSERIDVGDEIRSAADGAATLSLPRGVRVAIDRSTKADVRAVSELEQHLRLTLGRTSVSVPRPGGPREFAIETPDAQVIVHGTEFSVLVEQDPGSSSTFTSVSVTRGAVLVVHAGDQRLVRAGDHWSSRPAVQSPAVDTAPRAAVSGDGHDAAAAQPPAVSGDQSGRALTSSGDERGAHAPRPTGPAGERAIGARGVLAEQNRLFQAALDARKAGDDARTVDYLNELLTRFPHTTLAQEARVARYHALQRLGREP